MELEEIAFMLGLFSIPGLYIVGGIANKNPLANPRYFKIIGCYCIATAALGLLSIPFNNNRPNLYLFLLCPLYSITLYRLLLLWWYKAGHRRAPKFTYRERDPKLFWDEILQLFHLILSMSGPLFLLAIYYP